MLFPSLNSKAGRTLGALLLALSVCCPKSAIAWGGASAKHDRMSEIVQLEQRWRSAALAGDTAAMDRVLSDDYVGLTLQGKVNTKAQQLRRMRDRLLTFERLDISDVRVRTSRDVAVVTGRARVLGNSAGLSLDGSYRYTQVLRHMPNGTWIITNFEPRRVPGRSLRLLTSERAAHAG